MEDSSSAAAPERGSPDVAVPQSGPPPVELRTVPNEVRQLDPRYVALERAVGWILTASVSAGILTAAGVLWLTADLPRWASALLMPGWLLIMLAIGWFSYVWPEVHYRHLSYALDAEGIEIRSGVWWREVVSVPRSRVQHIDVSQGPLERSYGLGRLVLYTAGIDHSRVELPGLSHEVALFLRDHLLPRGGDDAV
jgi:membrane protein YdbS with pleckstrin-like domain